MTFAGAPGWLQHPGAQLRTVALPVAEAGTGRCAPALVSNTLGMRSLCICNGCSSQPQC